MTAPRYLTVKDVMAILQCGQTYAYDLVEKIGRANAPGIARVSESKFYEYLEGKDKPCASTPDASPTENESGGRRGRKPSAPFGDRPAALRERLPKSSSPDGNESEQIPYTPRRKLQRSA